MSAERVTDWQLIETAPRDGTPIDVWGPEHGRWTDVYWGKPDHTCGEMGQYCDSDWHSLKPCWVDSSFNEPVGRSRPGFTHWMRPPAPPAPAGDRDRQERPFMGFCALCGRLNRDPRPWDERCAMCPDCQDRDFVPADGAR